MSDLDSIPVTKSNSCQRSPFYRNTRELAYFAFTILSGDISAKKVASSADRAIPRLISLRTGCTASRRPNWSRRRNVGGHKLSSEPISGNKLSCCSSITKSISVLARICAAVSATRPPPTMMTRKGLSAAVITSNFNKSPW